MAQLIKYDKKFLILGNKNALKYKEIFPLIQQNKIWTGYRGFSGGMWFQANYEGRTEKIVDGVKLINVPSIWFTNLEIPKIHEEIVLWKSYTPEEYPTYLNYDAIEVGKTSEIPKDYDGKMGVPITFLDKYNPEQFEIVGMSLELADMKPIRERLGRNDGGPTFYIERDGKLLRLYDRIVIRRRK